MQATYPVNISEAFHINLQATNIENAPIYKEHIDLPMRAISAVPSAILTTVAEFPMWQPEAQPKERKRAEQKELRFCKKEC
jgi:hypothetical protein